MRRILLTVLSLVVLSTAARAAGPAEELQALAGELQQALGWVAGAADPPAEVREVGDGLYSLTLPLGENASREWRQTAPKPFQVLMLGHQSFPPGSPRSLATSALVYPFDRHNFWFAVINLGEETRTATTVHTIRCPELKVDRLGDLDYERASVTLYWHGSTDPYGRTGQCTEKVRVQGAGGRSARFFVRQ